MLTVYTDWMDAKMAFIRDHPGMAVLDWSDSSPEELVYLAETAVQHHHEVAIFLGALEGWMLSALQEIRLRALLRKFPVALICKYPLGLSAAWKNELRAIHVAYSNHGYSHSDHDGRAGTHAVPNEHGRAPEQTADPVAPAEGGKAGRPPTRRKLAGQDSETRQARGAQKAHGVRTQLDDASASVPRGRTSA